MSQSEAFKWAIQVVCEDWNEVSSEIYGFQISASNQSIEKTFLIWQEVLTGNSAFPPTPGPFKCAAAYLAIAMEHVHFVFQNLDGSPYEISPQSDRLWKSRFLFKTIPLLIKQWKLNNNGANLSKQWDVPSVHYRLDFLNFIRSCEFPVINAISTPPDKPTIELVRLNRQIMAYALIIESCYYLSENEPNCDVLNKTKISPSSLPEEVEPDLYFDCTIKPVPRD